MNDSSEANLHVLDYWRMFRYRWAFFLMAFIFVTGAAGITCYFLPREYYAKVTVEVKPDDATWKIFSNEITPTGSGFRHTGLAPTQFKIIQSKDVLYPVIERLKLNESWGEQGTPLTMERTYYQLMRKMGKSREFKNTDMFEIGVYSTDPGEAAAIVNSIGAEYQNRRKIEQETRLRQGLSEMEEEVQRKRLDVEKALAEMVRIREEEGIVDLTPDTISQSEVPERELVSRSELSVNEMRARVAELETQLSETKKLEPEALMSALRTLNIEDGNVARIQPLYQSVMTEEARLLSSGLGQNHPRVKAIRAQKDVLDKQLSDEVEGLRAALSTRLKVAQNTLITLEDKLEEDRAKYNETRKHGIGYTTAKERYLNAKSILQATENRLDTLRMQGRMSIHPARIWDQAEPPTAPARPNVPLYMAIAMGAGALIGLGIVFFLEYLDTSVKTIEEVEDVVEAPVFAVIPKKIRALVQIPGESPDAEAYRILQTNLDLIRKEKGAKTITFVSGGVGEGKSTTLNNVAYTYAMAGMRTLVVDADIRRSTQHHYFGMDKKNGFLDILQQRTSVESATRKTKIENLFFIPSGELKAGARGIVTEEGIAEFLGEVRDQYDIILFDSPPILGLSDASVIVSAVDATLMVVQYRRFPRSMLQRVRHAILQARGSLYGAVLNNVDTTRDSGYQYYTQYYDYYRPDRGNADKVRKKAAPEAVAQGDY